MARVSKRGFSYHCMRAWLLTSKSQTRAGSYLFKPDQCKSVMFPCICKFFTCVSPGDCGISHITSACDSTDATIAWDLPEKVPPYQAISQPIAHMADPQPEDLIMMSSSFILVTIIIPKCLAVWRIISKWESKTWSGTKRVQLSIYLWNPIFIIQ